MNKKVKFCVDCQKPILLNESIATCIKCFSLVHQRCSAFSIGENYCCTGCHTNIEEHRCKKCGYSEDEE